jgi:DNA-binding response OmpR family regulator
MSIVSVDGSKWDFNMKVLVVEDEQDIREILCEILTDEGFEVVTHDNGLNLLEQVKTNGPDIVLLDQVLPGCNGMEALRALRTDKTFGQIPVIMVTGLSGETEKISALEVGADDYVTKPFYPKELAARIRALARRSLVKNDLGAHTPLVEKNVISHHGFTIDFTAHRALVEGVEINLTLTEFKILAELLKLFGQVLTREKLRECALGNLNVTDRTIDVHVAALRKKLNHLGDKIETVRGVGYRFAE